MTYLALFWRQLMQLAFYQPDVFPMTKDRKSGRLIVG